MNGPPKQSAPANHGGRQGQIFESLPKAAKNPGGSQDVFRQARETYSIADAWRMLEFDGEPKASCRSPFRVERNPSFAIFADGRAWKDHGTGEGGDVIEFLRVGLGCDHAGVRDYLLERGGANRLEAPARAPQRAAKAPDPPRSIQWPAELVPGNAETWRAFAAKMRMHPTAINIAVHAGVLRFCKIDGVRCFALTDAANRAGEIRRIDGGMFGTRKAYPLAGVDKSWLPGAELLKGARKEAGIFLTEGPRDYLAALGLYSTYKREHGGEKSWLPAAVLGAGCKRLHPELVPWFRGRRVRICPDADTAGDAMGEAWKALLLDLGCTVDLVKLVRGKDLFDVAGEIQPEALFR